MRNTANISLPEKIVEQLKQEAKEARFSSTSSFFRHLLRLWNTEKLLRDLEISKRQFKEGKGKILHSWKDLD